MHWWRGQGCGLEAVARCPGLLDPRSQLDTKSSLCQNKCNTQAKVQLPVSHTKGRWLKKWQLWCVGLKLLYFDSRGNELTLIKDGVGGAGAFWSVCVLVIQLFRRMWPPRLCQLYKPRPVSSVHTRTPSSSSSPWCSDLTLSLPKEVWFMLTRCSGRGGCDWLQS